MNNDNNDVNTDRTMADNKVVTPMSFDYPEKRKLVCWKTAATISVAIAVCLVGAVVVLFLSGSNQPLENVQNVTVKPENTPENRPQEIPAEQEKPQEPQCDNQQSNIVSASPYMFKQEARVFDGTAWHDVEYNEDSAGYCYRLTSSSDIIEFRLVFTIKEDVLDRSAITIKNSLPEGMEYVDNSQTISRNRMTFEEPPSVTSNNRDFQVVYQSVMLTGFGDTYLKKGDGVTLTFRAKPLFNNSDSCKVVSSIAIVNIMPLYEGEGTPHEISTNIGFRFPCIDAKRTQNLPTE
jgi:hypothetical protein